MTITMTEDQARAFAHEWLDAWNSHDADRVAAHYHPDVEYYSPFVTRLAGADLLRGRDAFRDYAAAAIGRYPDLYFGPEHQIATGAGSVVITYRSVDNLLAMETLVLDDDWLVVRAHCHYTAGA